MGDALHGLVQMEFELAQLQHTCLDQSCWIAEIIIENQIPGKFGGQLEVRHYSYLFGLEKSFMAF
jgi:hypothetical protein